MVDAHARSDWCGWDANVHRKWWGHCNNGKQIKEEDGDVLSSILSS